MFMWQGKLSCQFRALSRFTVGLEKCEAWLKGKQQKCVPRVGSRERHVMSLP